MSEDLLTFSFDFSLHSLDNLKYLITVRSRNGLLMSSFHIVYKKRRD